MYKCREHGYNLTDRCRVCKKQIPLLKLPKFSLYDPHGSERRDEKFKQIN